MTLDDEGVRARRNLGAKLREAREYLGLSQDEVARDIGIARSAISRIESGLRKVAALELKKFAEMYQRPAAEFTAAVESALPETVQHLAREALQLNETDRAKLIRFAEFLVAKGNEEKA